MNKLLSLNELELMINMHIPDEIFDKYSNIRVKCRKRELIDLRFIFFHIAKKSGYTSITIGKYFKKDHSTILNGWKKFDRYINTDEEFTNKYKVIISYINKYYENGIRVLYEPIKKPVDSKSTLHPLLL